MEYCPLGCQRIPLNPFIYPHAVSGNCSDPSELEPLEATWYLVTPSHLPHQPAAWWPLQNTQWSGRKRSPRAWWTGYNERTACERASPPLRSLHSLRAKQRAALEKQRARLRGGSRAFPPQEAARAAVSPRTASPGPLGRAPRLGHGDDREGPASQDWWEGEESDAGKSASKWVVSSVTEQNSPSRWSSQ